MKLPYENELYELRKWIDFTNANLQMQFLHTPQEIQRVHQWINAITRGIQADYPFYATTLPCVANILFQQNEMGAIFLNPAAFGELVVIVRHIEAEPVVVQFWSDIHPRIVNVSHELYVDGHYSTAAEKAVKEVESRLREKFLELKTGAAVPAKIGDVIGALMSENGAFKFCDTTTTSGRDYDRSTFQDQTTLRKEFHDLCKQFLLNTVFQKNIPKSAQRISIRHLITGLYPAEI